MHKFFNYSTIEVVLLKKTRTLAIYLKRDEEQNAFNLEMLFELESVLSWCTGRVEIQSILIGSRSQIFSCGFDKKALKKMDASQAEKITKKLQKITNALLHLPQTVVIDMGELCLNLASELAIGCDIRIASVNANIAFDHTRLGIVPCSGGISLLSSIVGSAHARNWVLSAMNLSESSLQASGLINEFYDATNRLEVTQKILDAIYGQASMARIQAKFGLLQYVAFTAQESLEFESQVARASMISSDWQRSENEYKSAREVKDENVFKLPKRPEESN